MDVGDEENAGAIFFPWHRGIPYILYIKKQIQVYLLSVVLRGFTPLIQETNIILIIRFVLRSGQIRPLLYLKLYSI
jgi:hypothetical protein